MNRFIIFCFTLITAVCLPLSAYALPQSCNNNIIASAPDNRYQVHGDGTVSDLQTGLMWKQCGQGWTGNDCTVFEGRFRFTWQMALQEPSTLNTQGGFAGYTDWRLPNVKELLSLLEVSCYIPAINAAIFPATESSAYWSSSPYSSNLDYFAWVVNFSDGGYFGGKREDSYPVRLVRSER